MNTIDLTSIVVEKPNSVFRKCEDKNNSGYIFDNAINTARKIVMQLGSNILRTNHVMLTAKMQSGKTSVCNAVVNICFCLNSFYFFYQCIYYHQLHQKLVLSNVQMSVS